MRALVHARRNLALASFYPQRMTIRQPVTSLDSAGQASDAEPTDIGGYTDIPCALGVSGTGRGDRFFASERRRSELTAGTTIYHAALQGYYPAVAPRTMVVEVAEQEYNVLAVEHDLLRTTTRLLLELVEA